MLPSPYQPQIWDYKKADSTNIAKALDWANWEKLYDQKDNNAQVAVLYGTFFFLNYVPSKYITVDYKDSVWIKQNTKSKIKTINLL